MPITPRRPDSDPPRITSGTVTFNRPAPNPPVRRPTSTGAYRPPIQANTSGRYTATPSPPVEAPGAIPSIESFLGGDTGYQQQLREFANTLANFNADATRRKGSLESQFGLSKKAMEDQKVKDLDLLEDDYGARGLLRSGLYGTAVGDYETEFAKRLADLSRQQQEDLATLTQEQGQFSATQKLQEQAAREAAIRRRAEQYGVV